MRCNIIAQDKYFCESAATNITWEKIVIWYKGKNLIQNTKLNSIKDNKKFEINSVKILYSLPENSFTLISDDKFNDHIKLIHFTTSRNKPHECELFSHLYT